MRNLRSSRSGARLANSLAKRTRPRGTCGAQNAENPLLERVSRDGSDGTRTRDLRRDRPEVGFRCGFVPVRTLTAHGLGRYSEPLGVSMRLDSIGSCPLIAVGALRSASLWNARGPWPLPEVVRSPMCRLPPLYVRGRHARPPRAKAYASFVQSRTKLSSRQAHVPGQPPKPPWAAATRTPRAFWPAPPKPRAGTHGSTGRDCAEARF